MRLHWQLHCVGTLLIASALFGAAEVGATERIPVGPHFINYAHRGNSSIAPENTLAAYESGLQAGANAIEIDLQRTKDRVLVSFHDDTLERTTDAARVFGRRKKRPISDFTLAELKRLDAGSWKDVKYSGQRIPTLIEVVRLLGVRGTLVIDVKTNGAAEQVSADLNEAGFAQQRVVLFADAQGVVECSRILPDAKLLLIAKEVPPAHDDAWFVARQAEGVDGFSIGWKSLHKHPDFIAAARRHGMIVHTWTINDADTMRTALRAGVDGIGTDHPGTLAQMIEIKPR